LQSLLSKWKFSGLTVKNRLCSLPMEGNDAGSDGGPSDRTIARYRRLSQGGWGIIYVEAIAPDEKGKARPGQLVISKDNLDSFRRLTDEIRGASRAQPPVIIFQINHAGRYGLNPLIAYHDEILDPTWDIDPEMPEATTEELDAAAAASARAVKLAARAGADGADLKCCHGYLAAELFRPANGRVDRYGGRLENRLRFIRTMVDAALEEAGKNFFFGSRISLFEGIPGGIGTSVEDPGRFAPGDLYQLLFMLQESGASFICETIGIPYYRPELVRPWKKYEGREGILARHRELAAWVKKEFPALPVIGAGYTMLGKEFPADAERNVAGGGVDAIGLGRQSWADPDTPKKLMAADPDSVRWCRGCKTSNCSQLLRSGVPAGCVIYDPFYKERLKNLGKETRKESNKEK